MRPFCLISGLGLASAIKWDGPKPTNPASLVTASISPKPTKVAELVKRDAWPASFCGFVGGISCKMLQTVQQPQLTEKLSVLHVPRIPPVSGIQITLSLDAVQQRAKHASSSPHASMRTRQLQPQMTLSCLHGIFSSTS
jgi:hypothetical protein